MGFNFRKRIRIGKFLSLNIGKSGVSLSAGRRGFRQSFNTKGQARTTIGIPGTGLSYSKTINAKKLINTAGDKKKLNTASRNFSYEEEVRQFNEDLEYIVTLHHEADYPIDIGRNLSSGESKLFEPGEDGPYVREAKRIIKENKPGFFKRIFSGKQYRYDSEEILNHAETADKDLLSKWERNKRISSELLNMKEASPVEVLKKIELEKDMEFIEDLDCSLDSDGRLNVDITINPESVVPKEYITLTPTGKLSRREYSKTDYYSIVSQFVAALALRTGRNVFHLVSQEEILLHVHEMRMNSVSGLKSEELILSVLLDRETLYKINFEDIHPFEALIEFRHEVDFLKTKGFKEVSRLK
ncbi:DUF4236 domain-containing protein [Proteiniclasticum ruminis]|uniref:DUF4236 domain-containing protein n=1 Tax=Proteiniclasticum ruminis TaxID=398199 RepID=A0A1I4YQE5_9CLOT|nr:DUF4236 domain-containing protein [Proteiniclasticum ruminis]SFN40234.1 Protein of unknown function [Proteiniclasticum ruminis]